MNIPIKTITGKKEEYQLLLEKLGIHNQLQYKHTLSYALLANCLKLLSNLQ